MNKNYLLLIISVLIFSSMGIFVKSLQVSGLVAYFFAAAISLIIFTTLLIKEGRLIKFFLKKQIIIPILIGIFGVINNVSYFYAYQLTTIANATFVHYLAPVLVIILAPIILLEKIKKKIWLSIFIALIGLFILLIPSGLKIQGNLGILLAFISAVGFAFTLILFKKASKYYTNKEVLFSQMFFSVIILTPFILYLRPIVQSSDIGILITLGVVHQGIAVLLMITAIRGLLAQNVSIITYLEPVGATILAIFFLSEIPSYYTLIGGALILISCYLTIKK